MLYLFIMQLLKILHDNMDLIIKCDIKSMSSSAISTFDWLCYDVPCDINIYYIPRKSFHRVCIAENIEYFPYSMV